MLGARRGRVLLRDLGGAADLRPAVHQPRAADASAIVDKLTADGIAYKLADGGATIMVPKDQVYAQRISLSGAGLPAQSDAGYALLDKQGTMTSEFMQQVTYQRALEGELAKTIKAIDGVTGATVHLAMPEKDVFSDEQQKTTASVLVATVRGQEAQPGQVQAIVHLVASSVEGLDPEQVTVVGSDGPVLSAGRADAAAAGDQRAQQTQEFEQRMNAALQRMLDQALGPGHSVVQVTADLDFDSTETTTQTLRRATRTTRRCRSRPRPRPTRAPAPRAGGVLGPDNIQVPAGTAGGTGHVQPVDRDPQQRGRPGHRGAEGRSRGGPQAGGRGPARQHRRPGSGCGAAPAAGGLGGRARRDPGRHDRGQRLEVRHHRGGAGQEGAAAERRPRSDAQLKSWIETGRHGRSACSFCSSSPCWRAEPQEAQRPAKLTPEEVAQLEEMQAALETRPGAGS